MDIVWLAAVAGLWLGMVGMVKGLQRLGAAREPRS